MASIPRILIFVEKAIPYERSRRSSEQRCNVLCNGLQHPCAPLHHRADHLRVSIQDPEMEKGRIVALYPGKLFMQVLCCINK